MNVDKSANVVKFLQVYSILLHHLWIKHLLYPFFFFFQAEDGIRDGRVMEFRRVLFRSYAVWLTERATDALRGDIAVKGGLTTMLKAAHLAEAFHMNYEVHHGGNSLNNVAQLHFACAIRNTTYFEVLLPHGAHKYGLVEDIEIGKDGLARCPQVPGVGGMIDFDLIERKRLAYLS